MIADEQFIICDEEAYKLMDGDFSEYPDVQEGFWTVFTQDYRHIFYRHVTILDMVKFINQTRYYSFLCLWINGKPLKEILISENKKRRKK